MKISRSGNERILKIDLWKKAFSHFCGGNGLASYVQLFPSTLKGKWDNYPEWEMKFFDMNF